jgi:hypothetical protein
MSTRKFDSLTPRGKAVRVAKDVLLQLKAKKYKAKNLTYFSFEEFEKLLESYNKLPYYDYVEKEKEALKSDLKTTIASTKKCEVCALGASICSLANLNGPVTVQTAREGGKRELQEIFPGGQLSYIESAFEMEAMGYPHSFETRNAAIRLGKKYKNPDNRLRAIMNNIIQNRGVFKP